MAWMTLAEISSARGISLSEASALVKRQDCPAHHRATGTYFLL